jgi:hypothetical protein
VLGGGNLVGNFVPSSEICLRFVWFIFFLFFFVLLLPFFIIFFLGRAGKGRCLN